MRVNKYLKPGQAGMMLLWKRYRVGAAKRDLPWALDTETFEELTSSPCCYCGEAPGKTITYHSKTGTSESRAFASYTYTGIDRIDNSRGYELDNVCSCCYRCNMAKGTMTREEFVQWIVNAKEQLYLNEIPNLVETMRAKGVGEFELRGLKVKFHPNFSSTFGVSGSDGEEDLDPFVAAEKVKSAVEQFKKINDEDRLNLEWST